MKRILTVLLLVCCANAAFAQKGAGRVLGNYTHLTEQAARAIQREIRFTSRQLRLVDELEHYRQIPLKIVGVFNTGPAALALPVTQAKHLNLEAAQLSLNHDENIYKLAIARLGDYLAHISEAEGTEFIYRGMHLGDLGEIEHILLEGLEVDKTGYDAVYATQSFSFAMRYTNESPYRIPVLVALEGTLIDDLACDIMWPELGSYCSETDIPAAAISHVFAFLDINGKPAWYRVVLQDEMIFIPLPEEFPNE